MKNKIAQVFRFLVGGLFVFSGFVKSVDPLGTAIKLDKYYIAWSESIYHGFIELTAISLPVSYFVVSAEVLLGIFLLVNFKKEFTLKALLAVILFFTVLTCYTAITGQPTDCGCFGDFMVISPWASFGKDIVLLGMILFIIKNKEGIRPEFKGLKANTSMILVAVLVFGFSYYNLRHLPVIDFRPYKIGNDVTNLVLGKPGKYSYELAQKSDSTQIILVDDLTSDLLENYKYKGQVETVPAVPPVILEFRIDDESGNEVTKKVMTGNTAFLVIRKLKYLNEETGVELKRIEDELVKAGVHIYIMSGATKETFLKESNYQELTSPFCFVDEDISKAMIRANLGLVLFQEGVVKGKWELNDVPVGKVNDWFEK